MEWLLTLRLALSTSIRVGVVYLSSIEELPADKRGVLQSKNCVCVLSYIMLTTSSVPSQDLHNASVQRVQKRLVTSCCHQSLNMLPCSITFSRIVYVTCTSFSRRDGISL